MATKTYITCKSISDILTGPPLGNWSAGDSDRDNRGQRSFLFLLDTDSTDGGVIAITSFGASTSKTANQKLLCCNGQVRWITRQISGNGSLSGTVTFIMRVADPYTFAGSVTKYHVYAYITNGNALTERQVIANNVTDTVTWNNSYTYRAFTFSVSGNYSDGDRIVFEIGVNATPGAGSDTGVYMGWGTTDSSDVVQADAVNGDTATSKATWLEFSDNLTFYAASSAPANDACADATNIASLPYQSSLVDSTASADTDKSIWWTWTAPSNMKVIADVRGSNYAIGLRAWTGGCGSLSLAAVDAKIPWIGVSQSQISFDAIAGTQYWFQISSYRITIGGNAMFGAKNSGGVAYFALYEYSAPQTDDLFVSCQHIVSFRGTQPVNWLGDFYSLTPTGNAIDYTLRPMDNLNGGVHTGLRLYVSLFGSGPLVEILDLLTLNVGEMEIDYIDSPLNPVGRSQNTSTIIFDAAGNLILGFYGNHYNVVGIVADVPTGDVRKIDATHADDQAGAPFADALSYGVAYENGGSDFTDLAIDQDTLFYTSAGVLIKRYSLASGQLADFATLPAATGPRPGARSVRILPPGDGTGGVLVAYGDKVLRLDSGGTVIQTYTPTETEYAQDLDKIEITSDKTEFWVSDQFSTNIFKFNLATGTQTDRIVTYLPTGQLCGFTIYNGYRAAIESILPPSTGTIIVSKVVTPADTTSFAFTASTTLTPSSFTLTDGQTQTFTPIPGTYGIFETTGPNYVTTYVVSNDAGNDNTAITVSGGETVYVTVTNTAVRTIGSGLYQIFLGKRNDTYVNPNGSATTTAIPNPFWETALLPPEQ